MDFFAPTEEERPAMVYRRSLRAKRYRLTLQRDGTAVATIPARGTRREAERFVAEHSDWLERERKRQANLQRVAGPWVLGTRVLWRGQMEEIRRADTDGPPRIRLGSDAFRVPKLSADLRPTLEAHFLRLAKIELTARTWELAALTGRAVKSVSVRNQRSRWGSCSTTGTISLNWRLIQVPPAVRDYIIHHELAHLKEMNHSPQFWAQVEELYPGWRDAEAWLKNKGSLLGL